MGAMLRGIGDISKVNAAACADCMVQGNTAAAANPRLEATPYPASAPCRTKTMRY
jgi:hypothetical protein